MPAYQSTLQFKTRGSNGENRNKISIFRAENDKEAIKKIKRKVKRIGKKKLDLDTSFVERGRFYRKTIIIKKTIFKPSKMIFLNGNSVPVKPKPKDR